MNTLLRGCPLLLAISLLAACGTPPAPVTPVGFINHTRHSAADLWLIWKAAQQSVAEQIDLNPLQQSKSHAPADILPGDPRAVTIVPHQLTVASERDVSSVVLYAATGIYRADPTGMIPCPAPCDARFTTAYSRYQPPLTQYAASWETVGDNFNLILQYEFENQILLALGYDTTWR